MQINRVLGVIDASGEQQGECWERRRPRLLIKG